jgi:hypothetical protein
MIVSEQAAMPTIASLQSLFASRRRFRFSLVGVCGFPGAVYLVPDPLQPFDTLTDEVVRQFPALPPYGGLFTNPVPHLTVAQKPASGPAEIVEMLERKIELVSRYPFFPPEAGRASV